MSERPDGPARSARSAGPGLIDLILQMIGAAGRLVQGEIALAKAEAVQSLEDLVRAVIKLMVAAILAIGGLNLLAGAAVQGLIAAGLKPVWAYLAVGGGLLALALILTLLASRQIKRARLAPARSLDRMRRDAETLKSMVTPNGKPDPNRDTQP